MGNGFSLYRQIHWGLSEMKSLQQDPPAQEGRLSMDGQPSAVSRDFNVLTLRKRRQAAHRVMELLRQEGSAAFVGADWAKLRRFVNRASLKYRRNAYHGWPHAVDVTQTAAWLVTRTSFRRDLPPVDRFWLLIAAVVHDLDHPGHNNEWEVQMGSA